MKKPTLLLVASAIAVVAHSSPTFDSFTNLWYTAQHSNVLAMANQRLAVNSNDVAGVFMKASWDFEFLEPPALSNTLIRVIQIGNTCHTPAFASIFEVTKIDARCLLEDFALTPPEERVADRAKRGLPGKLPHYLEELKALDDDGYFDN